MPSSPDKVWIAGQSSQSNAVFVVGTLATDFVTKKKPELTHSTCLKQAHDLLMRHLRRRLKSSGTTQQQTSANPHK